jgi:hypothetical protein
VFSMSKNHAILERESTQPARERYSALVTGHRRLVLARSRPASRGEILAHGWWSGPSGVGGHVAVCRARTRTKRGVGRVRELGVRPVSARLGHARLRRGLAGSIKLTVPALRRGLFGLEEWKNKGIDKKNVILCLECRNKYIKCLKATISLSNASKSGFVP